MKVRKLSKINDFTSYINVEDVLVYVPVVLSVIEASLFQGYAGLLVNHKASMEDILLSYEVIHVQEHVHSISLCTV